MSLSIQNLKSKIDSFVASASSAEPFIGSYPHFCRKNAKRCVTCVTCVTNSQKAESNRFRTSFGSIPYAFLFAFRPSPFACFFDPRDASRCVTPWFNRLLRNTADEVVCLFPFNPKSKIENPKSLEPTVRFTVSYRRYTKKALYASYPS
ncbi:MAG: hypothetical protein C4532_14535 [Candidatus Abyssobacteria bacterium SURF_17]|uniref:Uncharacterized protein n=1 Tax=Candidatus Abyssobacteria bacterium SURF_17 TaxID=2093361 RepID=A0A419ETX3_9BACT|nr:MAG: hypothetical protein C4532_14535 [Candidatus Abyssubacteria bacterium SURF_17]